MISESNFVWGLRSKNMWMRSCAVCKALLKKFKLSDSIRCQCGWEWLG
jgi:DNA-directed RNA polymerase subunit RPC12/RpoP